MILRNRTARAVFFLFSVGCAALVTGCGDQFRPTVNFITTTTGNPAGPGNAVVLSTNPSGAASDTHISTSGDSNVGVVNVGNNPVFLGKGGAQAFTLNGDNTVSIYAALNPQGATVTTFSLPPTTSGAIGGAATANGNIYIAQQGPCVTAPPSNNGCVSVVPTGQNVVSLVVPAGLQPVMVASNAASAQAYVINQGDNTVTVIGQQDSSVVATIPVGAQPIWGVVSNDGVDVYVVNQGDGTVSVIDSTLNQVVATLNLDTKGKNTALNSNFAFFDNANRRVYVSNPGDKSVTVIKADSINVTNNPQILPVVLARIPVSGSPLSVGADLNGAHAYAALANCPVGTNQTNLLKNIPSCTGNQVSVIDTLAFAETKLIPVGTAPVSLSVANDGTRVYTANAIDKNMSIISTITNAELLRLGAPLQSLGCPNPNCSAGGVQTPFMVVTFP
jgi:YVTN family beta-propeller protein